jgi:DNA-binding PadR family transcriptional regulator
MTLTELLVLRYLMVRGEYCGADLARFLKQSTGTIYPILHRLHKKGYVTYRHVPQENWPELKLYRTTVKGDAESIRIMNQLMELPHQ